MTVHASKGFEAEHVIILRANSGRLGFPSEIVDDPILDMALPEPEEFDHAEGRRLFYVALTRARKSVTIIADREKPSVFVRELIEDAEYGAVVLGEPGVAEHKCGACGGRMLARRQRSGRPCFACEHGYLCGETLIPCNSCNADPDAGSGAFEGAARRAARGVHTGFPRLNPTSPKRNTGRPEGRPALSLVSCGR